MGFFSKSMKHSYHSPWRVGLLVGLALFLNAGAATAGKASSEPKQAKSTKSHQLPPAFTSLSATMQSRVCGELLTGLALGGVQSLQAQSGAKLKPQDSEAQQNAVYETGAQAVVLLTLSGSLSLPERLKAGEATQAIEQLAPEVYVATARYCGERVAAWVRSGQVNRDLMSKAYTQSRELLDAVLTAPALDGSS